MGWNLSTYEITGGATKKTTHYENLYSALMAPASVFQDDYDAHREPEHVHAALSANY
jgi:hypothetical protein